MVGRTIQVSGFPTNVSAESVKEFLERYTGEGTVYALKVRPPRTVGPRSRAFVIVQFTASSYAEDITYMANQRQLWYEGSYLTTRDGERDIVLKPRITMFNLEHATLHIGCQISDGSFYALWSVASVGVNFSFGLRKLEFLLSYLNVQYKLELFYESIWQIQLRRPHGQDAKFLLIQVEAAPRIYKKLPISPQSIYENPFLNFFRDIQDDQWVRATDFTPSSSIGQSSSLCLEVPCSCKLPNIRENFVYFKEIEGPFVLQSGSSFSHGLYLVPIIGPHQWIQLPYTILFKINSLVQNGIIMGPTLDDDFYRLVNPDLLPIRYVEHALETLSQLKESCFEPAKWLREQYRKYRASRHFPKSTTISLDPGLVYVHRVQITPTKVYFCGPVVNVSNRVLRQYDEDIDNFLRVAFVDEEWDKMRSTDLISRVVLANGERHTDIYKRILATLRNGIVIGDKKFEFLAFSSSQLRENSAWMFAPRNGLDAAGIRNWMGNFSKIRNVAKYSARLGQSFGSSKETLTVDRHEIEHIPDIEIEYKKYNFSDGIGKISADFARRVSTKCDIRGSTPSAFQIRYGGYKGVVAMDPMSPYKLSLRKSMLKYESDNTKLDVLAWSKYQPCFLNRQLITLLSTLGVRDHVFEMKQKEAVDQLDMILTDPIRAQEALEVMSPGENNRVLREMLICGYKPDAEPFLSMMLQTFRASKLLELRTKTRIFVPNGRSMMGCLDETRTLEYGQVFVQISCVGRRQIYDNDSFRFGGNQSDQQSIVIEGRVFVAKNPCLHPGDVRVLQAVNIPALHHMVDCVVFPQKGKRPHPNECSGSDLDGDVYFVSWDPELIPPRQSQPMEYVAEPPVVLDHDVEIEEVEEYFTNYMVNDSLGIIANAHTVFADREPSMANSEPCIELAKLFSIAVDFPKTGVPAEIPSKLHVKEYPDFMEKPDKPTYVSTRVIGKLFRAIKDIDPQTSHIKSFTKEVARQSYDLDMEVDGFKDYIDDAWWYKDQYDFKLGNLMDHYGIKTEAEIISGSIMKLAKSFTKNKDAEAISLAVRSLKKEVRGWFDEKGSEAGPPTDDEALAKASAWYHVTYHPDYFDTYNDGLNRAHFISFPWCVYDKLIRIKQKRMRMKREAELTSLQHSFGWNLRLG
ncbi:probable RNA-dependent RNA polymerase 1 [Magnolia sinica]|uniref:probable RNA-dependent RNA polymerase 1 n=1 Tax=Magnolia sinica TaxID=86752 RepID=UPI002659B837|nr:probable RNA-dependent RNA polymerase 1 [Magnolia sinica]XP_058080078.1 probable RNA-dependent RNA polymerase 1 [Magnolia sinica]XP_058080079.1 probable RNA-dependent RNA polymerase 1 [Magnolia sinica]XP_058080080.1 probable RNA-dependent RNA polymerase 1 [Magnolia sinica]XP_058080081.1 probable RNA-dependent RNA polymerase 1 [Magnolia sinica]